MQRIQFLLGIFLLWIMSSCATGKGGNRSIIKVPMEGKTPEVVIKEDNTSSASAMEPLIIAQINDSLQFEYLDTDRDFKLYDIKSYNYKSEKEITVKEGNDIAKNRKNNKQKQPDEEKISAPASNAALILISIAVGLILIELVVALLSASGATGILFLIAVVFGLFAFFMGLAALKKIKDGYEPESSRWKAVIAVVVGGLLWILFIVAFISALATGWL